jgi:hypothetical protein
VGFERNVSTIRRFVARVKHPHRRSKRPAGKPSQRRRRQLFPKVQPALSRFVGRERKPRRKEDRTREFRGRVLFSTRLEITGERNHTRGRPAVALASCAGFPCPALRPPGPITPSIALLSLMTPKLALIAPSNRGKRQAASLGVSLEQKGGPSLLAPGWPSDSLEPNDHLYRSCLGMHHQAGAPSTLSSCLR